MFLGTWLIFLEQKYFWLIRHCVNIFARWPSKFFAVGYSRVYTKDKRQEISYVIDSFSWNSFWIDADAALSEVDNGGQ